LPAQEREAEEGPREEDELAAGPSQEAAAAAAAAAAAKTAPPTQVNVSQSLCILFRFCLFMAVKVGLEVRIMDAG
jgi:3-oxoacyl-ACP reductase-like protein